MEPDELKLEEQGIFNKVVAHLRQQNAKSYVDERGILRCLYRSPFGLKCSIGCLIPDEVYEDVFEKWSLVDVIGMLSGELHARLCRHIQLLVKLQSCNDDFPVSRWEERIGKIAIDFDLTLPPKETTDEAPIPQDAC